MVDPLAEVVILLQPQAAFSKVVASAGPWRVRRVEAGSPFYCAVVDGSCCLAVDGHASVILEAGDFVLIPAAFGFSMSSRGPLPEEIQTFPVALQDGGFRLGVQAGPPDVRLLVGHCVFGSPDAALLVSLLPQLVHVRGDSKLAMIVHLVGEEARAQLPARELILKRLLEVLLIEALRCAAGTAAPPGLLRGLGDERVAVALRCMHQSPALAWTVAQLAKEAALSRSTLFERFSRAVGTPPMEYLLAWRMALAKNLLRRNEAGIADIAAQVGYSSASAFSVAFTRHVGQPPTRYVQEQKKTSPSS